MPWLSQTWSAYNIIQFYSQWSLLSISTGAEGTETYFWLSDNKAESSEVHCARRNGFAKVSWSIFPTFDYSNKKFTFSPGVCFNSFSRTNERKSCLKLKGDWYRKNPIRWKTVLRSRRTNLTNVSHHIIHQFSHSNRQLTEFLPCKEIGLVQKKRKDTRLL